jgi:hypothetical protein
LNVALVDLSKFAQERFPDIRFAGLPDVGLPRVATAVNDDERLDKGVKT